MQVRVAVALALFIAWSAALSYLVWNAALTKAAGREKDLMAQQLDKVLAEQAEGRKRAEKLQKTLDGLPKSEGKQRDVVRANPAKCDRPAPVADGLQDAVRASNAARALPVGP